MSQEKYYIYGYTGCPYFEKASTLGKELANELSNVEVVITEQSRTKYKKWLKNKTKELSISHDTSPFILYNENNIIGGYSDFVSYVKKEYPNADTVKKIS